MDLLSKAVDAGSMFWQALDERERLLVLYGAGYLAVMVLLAVNRSSRERLKREIREELASGDLSRA